MSDTLADGLIGYWRFNGNLEDSSGNNRTLLVGTSSNFATDFNGNANSCMGANSYLGLDERLILETDNSPFSFSIWFEKNTDNSNQILIGNGTSGVGGCYVQKNGYGQLQVVVGRAPEHREITLMSAAEYAELPSINLITVKYDGAILTAKVNNIVKFSGALPAHTPSETYKNFAVGCYTDRGGHAWKSRFDEARVYNRALTDEEETLIYNMGVNFNPGTKEDLMEQIYFGDDDIKVKITTEKAYMGGNLNKVLLLVSGIDIPLSVFAGNGGYEAVKAYLTTLGKSAPGLLENVKLLLTQVDNNGNEIIPEYFYILGSAGSHADMIQLLQAAADQCDYYGVVPLFQDSDFVRDLVTQVLVPKHRVAIISYPGKTIEAVGVPSGLPYAASDRIICIYDETMEGKNAAWAGRVLQYEKFIGWKWKVLTGCKVDALTPTEQQAAIASGLNVYKYIRGQASTSGSLTTKVGTGTDTVHIDSTIAKDIIIMNVATSLLDMFKSNEILTLGFHGKVEVEKAIRTALIYCGSLGLIESNEDNTYQYTVTVPDITAEMRQSRKLTGVKFSYVLATNMETIEVDGLELLALVGGDS